MLTPISLSTYVGRSRRMYRVELNIHHNMEFPWNFLWLISSYRSSRHECRYEVQFVAGGKRHWPVGVDRDPPSHPLPSGSTSSGAVRTSRCKRRPQTLPSTHWRHIWTCNWMRSAATWHALVAPGLPHARLCLMQLGAILFNFFAFPTVAVAYLLASLCHILARNALGGGLIVRLASETAGLDC